MWRTLGGDNRTHEGPIIGERSPIVSQRAECRIGFVTGQVVVVASVVIIRIDTASDGVDERQVVRLLAEQRQVFAQLDSWCGGSDRLKRASILKRCLGFHIPGVNMRRASAEKEQDRRLGFAATRVDDGTLCLGLRKSELQACHT